MEKELISIIASVYKGETYLRECIESVLNQDYQNIELIMVDDGSPDNSGHIMDEYARNDSRMRVIHKDNSGVSNSRNVALKEAKGTYVCLLDQDDVLAKDYVSYFYRLIKGNDADVAATPSPCKFFGKVPVGTDAKDYVDIVKGDEAAITMLYHKMVIAPWNKMVSKKLIDNNNIFFQPQFFNGEGFAFSIECFMNARKVAIGHKKVYYYRVGDPNSGASKFKEEWINSSINAQQYIKSTFRNPSPELMKAWSFSNWHTHCDALNVMVGCGVEKKYVELYSKIKDICKSEAYRAFFAPISLQQKFRGILFSIFPYMAAKIINHFRIRKFNKEPNLQKPNSGGANEQVVIIGLQVAAPSCLKLVA